MDSGTADEYLRKKTAEILTRVVSMRDLIHEQKINLHYQPIVSLVDRYQHHYEVLLRLPNGRSPFEDVKFAEEINIVHELDLAVTNGAIRRIMEATGEEASPQPGGEHVGQVAAERQLHRDVRARDRAAWARTARS
jgi:EAL domain-containing protein (putative c-di-GMP-specific phosphodiesterase class I)